MEITYKRINTELAREFSDYILPVVAESSDFGRYLFYAMLDEGHLVGLLVADPRRIGPEILSIGLSPAYQAKGLAVELLSYVLRDMAYMYVQHGSKSRNYFGATVIADLELAYRLSRVFESCGFKPDTDEYFYEASVRDIESSSSLMHPTVLQYLSGQEGKKKFFCIKDVTKKQLRAFGNKLAKEDIVPGIYPERLEEDISFVYVQDNSIEAGILFSKEEDGILQNVLLYRSQKVSSSDLLRLLTASAVEICKKYPKDTRLSFWAGDEDTTNLILKLFPEAEPKQEMITYILPFDMDAYRRYYQEQEEDI